MAVINVTGTPILYVINENKPVAIKTIRNITMDIKYKYMNSAKDNETFPVKMFPPSILYRSKYNIINII